VVVSDALTVTVRCLKRVTVMGISIVYVAAQTAKPCSWCTDWVIRFDVADFRCASNDAHDSEIAQRCSLTVRKTL
jgi:hypothetical protein